MPRLPLNILRPFLQQARQLPKPGKTNRAARLRFTACTSPNEKGLYLRSRQGAAHLNVKKAHNRRQRLSRDAFLHSSDRPRIMRLLGK